MKHFIRIAAILSIALLSFSCEKELTPGIIEGEETRLTQCTFNASIDEETKVTLSGLKSSWETGDKISVGQYGRYVGDGANRDGTRNEFTALASGNTVMFSGTVANYKVRDTSKDGSAESKSVENIFSFTYPYSALSDYNSGSSIGYLTVPSVQTGQVSDFGKYAHYNASFKESTSNTSYDAVNDKLTISASVSLTCITPVLKFNVPNSLGVIKIEIFGRDENGLSKGIAGEYHMRLSGSTSSFVAAADSVITIENGGNVLSDDTYVVLAPTSMTGVRQLQNDAKTLVFKLYNQDGGVARLVGRIKGNVPKNKVIKDLGSFPSSVEFKYDGPVNGELCMLAEKTLKVALQDTTAGSSFYYNYGISSCADPTTSSAQFLAATGFPVIQEEGHCVVKVLVHHPKYDDKILTALIRRFDFKSPNSLFDELKSNSLAAGASKTYDGLTATNKTESDPSFSGTSYLGFEKALFFSFAPLNNSKVSVYLKLAANTTSKARAFKVYKSSVEDSKAAGGPVGPILEDSSDVGTTASMRTASLDEMNAGDPISIWHNGGTRLYTYAIMEQAATLATIPAAPDEVVVSVIPNTTLPSSTTAHKTSDVFYNSNGYRFVLTETENDGSNYVKHWYADYFNWQIVGTMSANKIGCIELPAISGYLLTKVTFDTSSKDKWAYITKEPSNSNTTPEGNRLVTVKIPDKQTAGNVLTLTVPDPGDLDKYYFVATLSSKLNIRDLTLYYTKKTN